MTDVLDTPDARPADDPQVTPVRLASWPARAGAFAIDVLFGLAVIATLGLLAWSALDSWLWWVYAALAAVVMIAMLINRVLLPTTTGWSLGRSVFAIRVVGRGGTVGLLRLLVRDLAHLLDTAAVFIGWLWPLWDSRNRTFADLLLRTEVHCVDAPEQNVRRRTGIVLLSAAVLCAAAAGVGYLGVYRQAQAVHQAQQQIAEQGPRIVEQMLSYGVDSVDQDFGEAQALVTDNYRPQLVAQQDAVRKAGPTTNEYWAVSSAVLSASKTEASMLLAMQGQRGINPQDLKFITATVRVDFRKSGDQWRVDNLTVLKKPQSGGEGQ
ncbi:RDD family protein [Mycobacterium sp. 21AC1]|uniref:RDD family protein n=1 Tax=[Mycobacterium] appelbergii TaxID=2939269 RepID=UPI00293945A4|nr:RDD family protein [Mycobacterium sp. 21AC1]MDV3129998.1 RDD family protein [Mycobacterium sp. 21AC1]